MARNLNLDANYYQLDTIMLGKILTLLDHIRSYNGLKTFLLSSKDKHFRAAKFGKIECFKRVLTLIRNTELDYGESDIYGFMVISGPQHNMHLRK